MRSIRSGTSLRLVLGVAAGAILMFSVPAVTSAGGDAAAGKAKATACAACHTAIGNSDTPHLAGQRETYIIKQLKAFKAGDRKHPVMNAMAGVLSDADFENVAAFWASQAAGSDATTPEEAASARKTKMAFPKDFPKGFTLYDAKNRDDQHVLAQAYVNAVGLKAAKEGKPLPDGTQIIIVKSVPKMDADKKPISGKDGLWQTEKIAIFEGMEARANWGKDIPELIRNQDWNYALFNADKSPKEVNQAICLTCHLPVASQGYVFGLKKLQEKAGAK
jgi:cytochrome c553